MMQKVNHKYLIIAGSEKCGTTSVFQYLSDSGSFTVSKKKETDYFRKASDLSLAGYLQEFTEQQSDKIFLEASPGYLTDSRLAAKNMHATLKEYHLVFCLRNPLDRLKSSFLFHKSRLYIPKEMSFADYFDECLKYENGLKTSGTISEWCLRVPDAGKYYKHLCDFTYLNKDNITLVSFEAITTDPKSVVTTIQHKLGIDSSFYDTYDFNKSNVTAGHKNDTVQTLALGINKILENFWQKNPNIKKRLLRIYGKINGAPKEKIELSDSLKKKITDYYQDDLDALNDIHQIQFSIKN
jgi:hypothetical protein